MLLEGSCQCGAVRFRVESRHPVPYQRCYCSICRKAGGGGGYSINIEADAPTLVVEGNKHVKVHRAKRANPVGATGEPDARDRHSRHERHFCGQCGSHLWAFHPDWPELLHPVASAVDTPLPTPPAHVHMMLGSKAAWVTAEGTPEDAHFDGYPEKSLSDWHDEHHLTVE